MKRAHPIPRYVIPLILFSLAGVWLAGCDDSDPGNQDNLIQVISVETHGDVLADSDGNVLYVFTPDIKGESKCEGDCASTWPPFLADGVSPGSGLDGADVGVISRSDGTNQTTFKEWPLYTFSGDPQPGTANGDGINNRWYVAKPDYSLMIAEEQLMGEDGNNYTSDYDEGEEMTPFFTDAEGRTLYRFINDAANTNNFTNEDFSNNSVWPIFHTELVALPSGMNEDDFGEILVHGEADQLTYRGWPLYHFGQDESRGDTKGVSFPQPGIWPIVNDETPEAQ